MTLDGQQIDINKIAEYLKDGPVLVATNEGLGHAKLILNMHGGLFEVYNPLIPGGKGTISKQEIISGEAVAVKPLAPSPSVQSGSVQQHLQ